MRHEGPVPGPSRAGHLHRVLGVAVGLGLVGLVIAWVWGEVSVRADADSAHRLMEARRFDEAERALGRWLRARPGSAEAYLLKARLAYARGRFGDCQKALGRARELGLDEKEYRRLDALLLAHSGRTREAEEALVRVAQESDRPDAEILEALARIYLESYRLPLASAVLDRWVRVDPDNPKPYLWMTEIDLRAEQGGPERAIEHFREALRRDPDLDRARRGLAEALREAQRPEEAAREFAVYLRRKPDDPDARLGAARTALVLGRESEAIKHLDRALAIDPDHAEALQERAGIDLTHGDLEKALARLDRAAQIDPYHAEVAYRRGLTLERLGHREEAQQEKTRSKRLRAEQKRLTEIQHQFNQDPKNDQLACEIARWMFDHGQEQAGVRWAKTVLTHAPGHPEANRLLAEYYDRQGEVGLANFYKMQANQDARR